MMWPWWSHYNVIIQVDLAQNEYKHKIICSGIFHIPSSFMTLINSSAFPSPPIWRLYSVGHYAAPEETCRYVLISRQEGLVECALWCWRATSTVIAAHARCTLSSASTRAILFISSLLNTRGSHLSAPFSLIPFHVPLSPLLLRPCFPVRSGGWVTGNLCRTLARWSLKLGLRICLDTLSR